MPSSARARRVEIVAPAPTGAPLKLGPLRVLALLKCPFLPVDALAARAAGARRETVAGTSEFSELLPFKLFNTGGQPQRHERSYIFSKIVHILRNCSHESR